MAKPPERKWRTLRKITPPQEMSFAEAVEHLPVADVIPQSEVEIPLVPVEPVIKEEEGPVSVLLALPVASTARLIRETLESFTAARVVVTADPLRAFELALQRKYSLFLFGMSVGELSGPLLYELISKAYVAGRGSRLLAPGVIFIREKDDPKLPESLSRDVRVKDVLNKPIRIERLLQSVGGMIEVKDPTAR